VLDIEKFGPERVISISSVPEYNEQAKKRGVSRIVLKDNKHLDVFADLLKKEIEIFLKSTTLSEKNIHHIF
jgi:hypothetical protein